HRPTHEEVVLDPEAVVGEHPDTEIGHLGHGCELFTGSIDRYGSGGVHIAGGRLTELEHLAHHRGRVDSRNGVGPGQDRGETTERGSTGSGLYRLGFLVTGFA